MKTYDPNKPAGTSEIEEQAWRPHLDGGHGSGRSRLTENESPGGAGAGRIVECGLLVPAGGSEAGYRGQNASGGAEEPRTGRCERSEERRVGKEWRSRWSP